MPTVMRFTGTLGNTLRRSFGRPKELSWLHLQGNGQPPENLEAYVELSLLDLAEIAPAHLSLQGKLVL